MASIREVLAVEETKVADVFKGPAVESRIERTFGGQITAQAVAAAQRTVSGKDIHSLHGYFVGPGDASRPIEIGSNAFGRGDPLLIGRCVSTKVTCSFLLSWLVFTATVTMVRSIRTPRRRY